MDTTPVIVERSVLIGLEAIKNSGATNMFDYQTVMAIARDCNYTETYKWLRVNKSAYGKGIFCGFISDPELPKEKLN